MTSDQQKVNDFCLETVGGSLPPFHATNELEKDSWSHLQPSPDLESTIFAIFKCHGRPNFQSHVILTPMNLIIRTAFLSVENILVRKNLKELEGPFPQKDGLPTIAIIFINQQRLGGQRINRFSEQNLQDFVA